MTDADPADRQDLQVLGASAVDALVVLWEPGAQVSMPLWQHTQPLVVAVHEALADLRGTLPGSGVPDLAERLRADPLSPGPRAMLARQITAEAGVSPAAFAELLRAAGDYRSQGGVFPVGGVCAQVVIDTASAPAGPRAPRPRVSVSHGSWELTVVVDFRAAPDDKSRLRNALATLRALEDQSLDPARFRIVVVEQDTLPRHVAKVAPYADGYLHIPHGGPYNRSKAHNQGAELAGGRGEFLCFLDADMLVDRGFLERTLIAVRTLKASALLPYDQVIYLDDRSSACGIAQRFSTDRAVDPEALSGYLLTPTVGGCLVLETALFDASGGYDERYEGWGDEDNEFFHRMDRAAGVRRMVGVLYHLDHSRPIMRPCDPLVPPVVFAGQAAAPAPVIT